MIFCVLIYESLRCGTWEKLAAKVSGSQMIRNRPYLFHCCWHWLQHLPRLEVGYPIQSKQKLWKEDREHRWGVWKNSSLFTELTDKCILQIVLQLFKHFSTIYLLLIAAATFVAWHLKVCLNSNLWFYQFYVTRWGQIFLKQNTSTCAAGANCRFNHKVS